MDTNYGLATWAMYGGDLTIFVGNEPYTPESGIVVTSASLRDALQAIVGGYEVARRAVTAEDDE